MTAFDQQLGEPHDAMVSRLQRRLDRERRARHEAETISERATRELYERQQELALLVAAMQAANDSTNLENSLSRALRHVCEYMGWPVGHVYLSDPDVGLRPTGIWHLDDPARFEAFRQVTEMTPLARGEGLGGRVLVGGQPLWLPDVTVDDNFPRARVGGDIQVRAGFGFPILIGTEVVGVMEFFKDAPEPPNERLLALVSQIGTELGRAIERDRARAAEQRLHDELAARAAELERSNSELQQFASIASHDLQEPLRKVRTFTQRVVSTEGDQLSETGQDYLRRANSGAMRMQALIDGLLAFSRVSTRGRPFAPVDLAVLTADVLEDLHAAVQRSDATVTVAPLPTIDADQLQMRQLVQNLVSNALKFRCEGVTPEITIDAAVAGETVTLTVTDNGIGFDAEYRERIFRVFERLHGRSEYEGTGIGLALCRKIAERHGGWIQADPLPEGGSRFTVVMPVRQPAPLSAAA